MEFSLILHVLWYAWVHFLELFLRSDLNFWHFWTVFGCASLKLDLHFELVDLSYEDLFCFDCQAVDIRNASSSRKYLIWWCNSESSLEWSQLWVIEMFYDQLLANTPAFGEYLSCTDLVAFRKFRCCYQLWGSTSQWALSCRHSQSSVLRETGTWNSGWDSFDWALHVC